MALITVHAEIFVGLIGILVDCVTIQIFIQSFYNKIQYFALPNQSEVYKNVIIFEIIS